MPGKAAPSLVVEASSAYPATKAIGEKGEIIRGESGVLTRLRNTGGGVIHSGTQSGNHSRTNEDDRGDQPDEGLTGEPGSTHHSDNMPGRSKQPYMYLTRASRSGPDCDPLAA